MANRWTEDRVPASTPMDSRISRLFEATESEAELTAKYILHPHSALAETAARLRLDRDAAWDKCRTLQDKLDATGRALVAARLHVADLQEAMEADPEADAVQPEHQKSAKSRPSERLTLEGTRVRAPGLRGKARVPRVPWWRRINWNALLVLVLAMGGWGLFLGFVWLAAKAAEVIAR